LPVALQTTRFWHSAARWFFGLPALLSLIGSFVPSFGLCTAAVGIPNYFFLELSSVSAHSPIRSWPILSRLGSS